MGILSGIFDGVGGKIVESMDGLFTSDEERLKAENELQTILQKGEQQIREAVAKHQEQLTKRMELDMKSDSWLSKNVRPMSLIFLLIVYTVLALTDGNLTWDEHNFEIGIQYVDGYRNFLLMVFAFYFGGRTFEKVKKTEVKSKPKKKVDEKKAVDSDDDWDNDNWD